MTVVPAPEIDHLATEKFAPLRIVAVPPPASASVPAPLTDPPIFDVPVSARMSPAFSATSEPLLTNVRWLSPIWPEANASMALALVNVAAAFPSLVMSAPAPFSPI